MVFKYADLKRIKKHIYRELNIRTKYKVRLLRRHDCISVVTNGEETIAWAAMNPLLKLIVLPIANKKYPDWVPHIYVCFAHEFIHVWQHENGMEFNEDQADEMGIGFINELFGTEIEFVPCDTGKYKRNTKEV